MDRLTGRNCLVTGAGRGIGLAFAEALMREGANVTLVDVDPSVADVAKELAEKVTGPGFGRAIGVKANVAERDDIRAAIERTVKEFGSLDDFLQKWNGSKKKAAIIDALAEYGIELPKLAKEVGKDYGDFDLICHIAFDQPPLTRAERANNVKKRNYFTQYGDKARAVLEALLDKYADEGITSIENNNVLKLDPFKQLGTPVEIINGVFGGKAQYEAALQALETELFKQAS